LEEIDSWLGIEDSLEFKGQVVLDLLEKRIGLRELARKHNLSRNLLSQ
jgi:transposase-like protein